MACFVQLSVHWLTGFSSRLLCSIFGTLDDWILLPIANVALWLALFDSNFDFQYIGLTGLNSRYRMQATTTAAATTTAEARSHRNSIFLIQNALFVVVRMSIFCLASMTGPTMQKNLNWSIWRRSTSIAGFPWHQGQLSLVEFHSNCLACV